MVIPALQGSPSVVDIATESITRDAAQLKAPTRVGADIHYYLADRVQSHPLGFLVESSPFIAASLQHDALHQDMTDAAAAMGYVLQRDRMRAQQMAQKTQGDMWGTSSGDEATLRNALHTYQHQLETTATDFAMGNFSGARDHYASAADLGVGITPWYREITQTDQLRRLPANIAVTGTAAAASTLGGKYLLAKGAVMTLTHRSLSWLVFDTPFWRKEGVLANISNLGMDVVESAALLGWFKLIGVAAHALPQFTEEFAGAFTGTWNTTSRLTLDWAAINTFNFAAAVLPDHPDVPDQLTWNYQAENAGTILGLRTVFSAARTVKSTVAVTALKSTSMQEVWEAWQAIKKAGVISSDDLTRDHFTWDFPVTGNPKYPIERYFAPRALSTDDFKILHNVYDHVDANVPSGSILNIPLSRISLLHSLVDVMLPEHKIGVSYPGPKIPKLLQKLKDIRVQFEKNPDQVIPHFLVGDNSRGPWAVMFPSGDVMVMDGHNRLATLSLAARLGMIPADWLEHIPIEVCPYTGSFPEPLVRWVLSNGQRLTWQNQLPPPELDSTWLPPKILTPLRLKKGLKSQSIQKVWETWEEIEKTRAIDPNGITRANFTWDFPVNGNPKYPIERYYSPKAFGPDSFKILRTVYEYMKAHTHPNTELTTPLSSISPYHSLNDFLLPAHQGGGYYPGPKIPQLLQKLKTLRSNGQNSPEKIIGHFVAGDHYDEATVVMFPSGDMVAFDGHHRLATLFLAARLGVIPADWLEHIPVWVNSYTGTMPEPLVRWMLSNGQVLTWENQLPPPELDHLWLP